MKLIRKLNPVIICYLLGILIGNVEIFPEGFDVLQNQLSTVVVALSIPLLLFSMNISRWSRTSIRAVAALGLAVLASATILGGVYLLFIITIAKPLLSRVLKPFQKDESVAIEEIDPLATARFGDIFRKPYRIHLFTTLRGHGGRCHP